VKALDAAEKDAVGALLSEFAKKHRPAKGNSTVLVSKDKTISVAVGANGTEKSPNAPELELDPVGTKYDIAIGGNGSDAKTGTGGRGGDVALKSRTKAKVFLLGGNGGKGAKGKSNEIGKPGGDGGSAWFDEPLEDGLAMPGHGGDGGQGGLGAAGGPGGKGGATGARPAK